MFSKAWPIFLLTAIARVAVFRMYNSLGTSGNPLNFLRESLKPSSLSFPHEGAMAFPRGFLTCDVTPDRSRYEHPTAYLFFFLASPSSLWELSSQTRDQTRAPGSGSAES